MSLSMLFLPQAILRLALSRMASRAIFEGLMELGRRRRRSFVLQWHVRLSGDLIVNGYFSPVMTLEWLVSARARNCRTPARATVQVRMWVESLNA
ncbi:hypothetical protein EJ05DRAFT_478541 [Pseudovirgaria hyperparasitica]|uniref:Uncharacterized protein n=1 Tax=Pseudovirgaria hyperparasitica TaxID=470096 RepID=A0A6A6VZ45_9PEZI|nr:uncharacterized protein EJ05DRAFT_478541 [Pseudovirgaria hyperparasitica]KAF2755563.1 hypothetical protein EJ05DRAFT_478541 [Pseudovirgaria hyperparasitica]